MKPGRRGAKWALLAGLLLLAQPGRAQDIGVSPEEEAALDEAAGLLEDRAEAPERASRPTPRPAIWLLADADTKIFLFGTYHVLPNGFVWRSPLFNDIVRRSDELVVEVTQAEAQENMAEAMGPAMLGKEAPILWRVSPGRRRALAEMVAELGVPIERFDGVQTWVAAMTLAVAQIVRGMADTEDPDAGTAGMGIAGGDPAGDEGEARPNPLEHMAGVETILEAEFQANGRPISGVETVAQQMAIFNSLTFTEQRRMLEAMVDVWRKGMLDGPVDIGENAWVSGDVEAIGRDAQGEAGNAFYEAILPRRNAAWTLWLQRRLDRPGTLLFAVGAAHLAGPDSVQVMLAARGLTVRRIQ